MEVKMKYLFTVLLIVISVTCSAQTKKIFFESGLSVGMQSVSASITSQYYNPSNFIAGAGITFTGIMDYNGIKKPKADGEINQLSYELPIKGVEERGPYGLGAGIRLISNTGLAIEGGYFLTWHSKYTIYDLSGSSVKYTWEQNKTKGYVYGKLLIIAPENKFTIGFGSSEIEKASLYFGLRF
jgi:hypothetical protein